MTIACGSLEFAQARIGARHGLRADEALWRRVEHVREFAGLLDLLRATPLGRWTHGVLPASDAHAIEARLRARWREEAAAVATWMPEAWQPSLEWFATWPDLPVVAHDQKGGARWPWLERDPLYRELAAQPSRDHAGRRGPVAILHAQRMLVTHGDAVGAWCDEWRQRMPAAGRGEHGMRTLVALLSREHATASSAPLPASAMRRHALQERMRVLFRAATLSPALAFVHLVLEALEVERLRGELVRRATFPPWPAAPG